MGLFTSDKHAARKAPRISIYKRASERAKKIQEREAERKKERKRERVPPFAEERTHTTQPRRREYVHLNFEGGREGIRPRSLRLLRGCPLRRDSHPPAGETPFNDRVPVRRDPPDRIFRHLIVRPIRFLGKLPILRVAQWHERTRVRISPARDAYGFRVGTRGGLDSARDAAREIRKKEEKHASTRRAGGKLRTRASRRSKQDAGMPVLAVAGNRLEKSRKRERERKRALRNEYSPWMQLRPRVSCRELSLQRSQRRTVRGSRTRTRLRYREYPRRPREGEGGREGERGRKTERQGAEEQESREKEDGKEREGEGGRERERDAEYTQRGEPGATTVGCRSHFTVIPHAHTPMAATRVEERAHRHDGNFTSLGSAPTHTSSAAAPPIRPVSHMTSGAAENSVYIREWPGGRPVPSVRPSVRCSERDTRIPDKNTRACRVARTYKHGRSVYV